MLENVRSPVTGKMLLHTYGKMPDRFVHVTGITACTCKLVKHTWTEPARDRVFTPNMLPIVMSRPTFYLRNEIIFAVWEPSWYFFRNKFPLLCKMCLFRSEEIGNMTSFVRLPFIRRILILSKLTMECLTGLREEGDWHETWALPNI